MALTLPYPNMDFTPLDILTADEMDQLVANIEYLAQRFPVTTTRDSLWSGTISDTATTATLSEALVDGGVYIATFMAISGAYQASFVFLGGQTTHQFYVSDGTNYVRWRLDFQDNMKDFRLGTITTNTSTPANYALKRIGRLNTKA